MASRVTASEVAHALSNGRKVKKSGNSFLVSCPVPGHEDKNPSCLIFDKPDSDGIGIKCQSGCSQEATWQALTDLGYVPKKAEKKFKDIPDEDCKKEFIKSWNWYQADGSLHLVTTRLELKRQDGSIKKKIVFPKLPNGDKPGPDYPLIPLYLPDVLKAASEGRVIFDVEGEGKADILREWGLCGTTTGASSKKKNWETAKTWEHFRGSSCVVILDDNDVPGLKWATFKASKFHEHGIPVKLVHLPDLGKRSNDHGKDIKDWKNQGHTKEELIELVRTWPAFAPEEFEEEPSNVTDMFAHPKDYLTDKFNSEHFLKLHGDNLIFVADRGKGGRWFIWNGHRFLEDTKEAVMNLVEDANTKLELAYKGLRLNTETKDRWLTKSLQVAGMSTTERATRKKKAIMSHEMDTDPEILNCANGLLHLPTLELRPHTRAWRDLCQTPNKYDPTALCPKFLKYLRQWFCNDEDLIMFDQRHMGMCLTGFTRDQKIVVNKGEGGGGKSQLLELKQYCFGRDYFHKIPDAVFKDTDGDGNASSDYHQFVGKRLGVWGEVKKHIKLDEKKLKEVSDGGTLDARANYGEVYNYKSQLHLIFNSNYPLNIPNDKSLTRRVLYVPFDALIREEDKVEGLAEKLWAEEGPGIFNYYCQGALAYLADGLPVPKVIETFSGETFGEGDMYKQFAVDHCVEVVTELAGTKISVLHKAFLTMLRDQNHERKPTLSKFCSELERLGLNKKRWRPTEVERYLKLKPEYLYTVKED